MPHPAQGTICFPSAHLDAPTHAVWSVLLSSPSRNHKCAILTIATQMQPSQSRYDLRSRDKRRTILNNKDRPARLVHGTQRLAWADEHHAYVPPRSPRSAAMLAPPYLCQPMPCTGEAGSPNNAPSIKVKPRSSNNKLYNSHFELASRSRDSIEMHGTRATHMYHYDRKAPVLRPVIMRLTWLAAFIHVPHRLFWGRAAPTRVQQFHACQPACRRF